ncbi:MAG TPA: hypothetical protein VGR71_11995 [Nitrospira sp.]|nr:hypothetical protein [Nitrospira sp.]
MKVTNNVTPSNGVILVVLTATFVGDATDASDKQKIAAFGDPQINLAGKVLQDPNNPSFTFGFQTDQLIVGLTTQMQNFTARFLTQLPPVTTPTGQPSVPTWFKRHREEEEREHGVPILGPLDCIVASEAAQNEAATAWVAIMVTRIQSAMGILRSQIVIPTIPPTTV